MNTNPAYYNLPARTQLEKLNENNLGIRKVIKSRIIRKDAEKITEIARQIKRIEPELEVTLICTNNICSKSLTLLKEENIGVRFV